MKVGLRKLFGGLVSGEGILTDLNTILDYLLENIKRHFDISDQTVV